MASRMMHLAVAYRLADLIDPSQRERFFSGSVIPDALPKDKGHYYKFFDGSTRKTYDLTGFREKFADRLRDGLYLGYYMHLLEDIVFRDHLYHEVGYVPTDAKVVQLHKDYTLLNKYLSDKYGIKSVPSVPENIVNEPLVTGQTEAVRNFIADMHRDLTNHPDGVCVCYTENIADEFLDRAVSVCIKELAALDGKGEHIDEYSLSWLKHS